MSRIKKIQAYNNIAYLRDTPLAMIIIIPSIEDYLVSVIKQILSFAKGRKIINEIDQIIIHVNRNVIVFWYEDLEESGSAFEFKFRVHQWSYTPTIDHKFHIDFARIPKDSIPSDKSLKSLIKVEEDVIESKLMRALSIATNLDYYRRSQAE